MSSSYDNTVGPRNQASMPTPPPPPPGPGQLRAGDGPWLLLPGVKPTHETCPADTPKRWRR